MCVCVTNLLTNSSNPFLRSSIKSSSNRPTHNNIYTHPRYERGAGLPSSPLNGSCLLKALPGRGGTTICRGQHDVTGSV